MTDPHLYPTHADLIDDAVIADRALSAQVADIQALYTRDNRPWIIGFSGGKDSTTVLSLVYYAIAALPQDQRKKHVYVVSSDTLVETPVVVDMFMGVIKTLNKLAPKQGIPLSAHPVLPDMGQTFWVNLLGKGYPAPTTRFRWCTERMKINPVNEFITDKVAKHGEVILVLGSRAAESSARAQAINKHSINGSALSRHTTLPNAYIYLPIKAWSADDVWEYLLSAPCPWGGNNRELFELYKGSNQGECPLVIDKSTPSCGNSRFGCWTCTVVTTDKALHGLIESGESWMQPLLDFRNKLHETTIPENKTKYRNVKRRSGKITYQKGPIDADSNPQIKHIPGPYYMTYRKAWLAELLTIERGLREDGIDIELIRRDELHAIRQAWLTDPNEPDWGDALPAIYASVYPTDNLDWVHDDARLFSASDADLLKTLEAKHALPAELIMKLIDVEVSMQGLSRRTGLLSKLTHVLDCDWDSLQATTQRRAAYVGTSVYATKKDELETKLKALD